jgi:hypothetical protein
MVRLAHDEPSIPLKDREGTISTPFRKIFAIICLSPVSLRKGRAPNQQEDQRWLHGDYKAAPYLLTYRLYKKFVEIAE